MHVRSGVEVINFTLANFSNGEDLKGPTVGLPKTPCRPMHERALAGELTALELTTCEDCHDVYDLGLVSDTSHY